MLENNNDQGPGTGFWMSIAMILFIICLVAYVAWKG